MHGLVYGYVYLEDLDKKRLTLGYVSHESKDLLGNFGQVQYMVFYGGRNIMHLTNCSSYQNGIMHHFVRQGIDGGGVVNTEASCIGMLT